MSNTLLTRSTLIEAPLEVVQPLIADLHHWESWSPWQELDLAMRQAYFGEPQGVGASMTWEGNKKAGSGRMTVVTAEADRVEIDIEFFKPWKATNRSSFVLKPAGQTTTVDWTMSGEQNLLMKVMFRVLNMQKRIGADFERGLERLKSVAEA